MFHQLRAFAYPFVLGLRRLLPLTAKSDQRNGKGEMLFLLFIFCSLNVNLADDNDCLAAHSRILNYVFFFGGK